MKNMAEDLEGAACQVCGANHLEGIPSYQRLMRVTSDCRPFANGGRLFQCKTCSAVQKVPDARWRADCDAIYAAYESYALSTGTEAAVCDADANVFAPRSEIVLRHVREATDLPAGDLPAQGRLLDFGCGSGPTSAAASKVLTGWSIDGFDQDRRAADALARIEGFDTLFTGALSVLPSRYDLIVLMHSLEHIPNCFETLAILATKLRPGGKIIVQVPDRNANPYDLLVADHIVHYDAASLYRMGLRAALSPVFMSRSWVAKELSLILDSSSPPCAAPDAGSVSAEAQVDWLSRSAEVFRAAARQRPLCIFGTSIVATWIGSLIGAPPDLYLDEDPAKIGRSLNGVSIAAPSDAPPGATVILAMGPSVAVRVMARLNALPVNFVAPPPV
jgi:SAM-dependent methyltransferase